MSDSQLLGSFLTITIFLFGAVLGFIRMMISRSWDQQREYLEKEFGHLKEADRLNAERLAALEKDLSNLKAELPLQYVRREDWVRFQSVLDGKLDRAMELLRDVMDSIGTRPARRGGDNG